MLLDVTSASLSEQELPIYNELKSIYRKLMVDRRIFEVNFAYNKLTHHDADVSETEVNKLLVSLNTYTTKVTFCSHYIHPAFNHFLSKCRILAIIIYLLL